MTAADSIEQRLRRTLRAVAEQPIPPPVIDTEPPLSGRPAPPSRRHLRPLVGALAAIVAIAAVALGVAYGPRSSVPGSQATPATQPSPGPDLIALGPEIAWPNLLAANNGKLWVSGFAADPGGPAPLQELDPDTGKILSTISLPDDFPNEIAATDNAIWLRSQQGEESTHLVKVDALTHQILANIALHKDGGLAVTPDAVWTVDGSFGLLRIDPRTGRRIATIALPGGLYAPSAITAGSLGVWLGSSYDGSILRVNEQTNTVGLVTHVGTSVDQMVELGSSLWVSTGTALVEIRASTGAPDRTVELGAPILSLGSDGHSLWATTDKPNPRAIRVDPRSGDLAPLPLPAGVAGLSAFATDPTTGVTWATASSPHPSLVRLAP